MSFAQDIKKFSRQADTRINEVRKATAIELFSNIIRATPVGNVDLWDIDDAWKARIKASGYKGGRLRGNWFASVGSINLSTDKRIDPKGGITINNMRKAVDATPKGRDADIFLANSVPYAGRIEFGSYSKKQAPKGMVRVNTTASKMRAALRRAIGRVAR